MKVDNLGVDKNPTPPQSSPSPLLPPSPYLPPSYSADNHILHSRDEIELRSMQNYRNAILGATPFYAIYVVMVYLGHFPLTRFVILLVLPMLAAGCFLLNGYLSLDNAKSDKLSYTLLGIFIIILGFGFFVAPLFLL